MHTFTGMLFTFLFSQNNKNNRPPLLKLRWPIITKHLLPGRVRFQIPLIVGKEKVFGELAAQLKKIDGIKKVDYSIITGSLLIHFDENILQADFLFTIIIRLLGFEKELERIPSPTISKEIDRFGKALDHAVFSQTKGLLDLKTLVSVSLGLFGIAKLISKPLTMPAAVTMIWWSYNSLIQNNKKGS